MIHIFVGTKAQFIKMAPIMKELDRRGIHYNFIDAGQHGDLTGDLRRQFGLREPDVRLRPVRDNINTLGRAVNWTTKSLGEIVFARREIYQRIFFREPGICLIHGDTLTTLLALLYAKRCGIKVAHIEAGLRSYRLFDPFPEEIIRLIAMRYSDVLFAPSDWAAENLCRMGYREKTVNAGGNTIAEAVRYAVQNLHPDRRPKKPHVVVTVHRVETIFSRRRMTRVVSLLERIADERKVLFVLHDPTRRQLTRFGLDKRLGQHDSIQMLPLQGYFTFVNLLAGADFIVTDGGSIQEESYFLNVPCLIMRTKTERLEGLGQNVVLAGFDEEKIDHFLQTFTALRRTETADDSHPARKIVAHLLQVI